MLAIGITKCRALNIPQLVWCPTPFFQYPMLFVLAVLFVFGVDVVTALFL